MNNEEKVKMLIDNIEIKGIITHHSSGGCNIKIIKPFQNLSKESWHPYIYLARIAFIRRNHDTRIPETLKYLYNIGKYIAKEMNNLKEKLNYFDNVISEITKTEEFKIK